MRLHLVDAAIQFCEETGVVRFTTDPLLTVAGQATYDLDIPGNTQLDRVHNVWVDGRPLRTPATAGADLLDAFTSTPAVVGSPAFVTVIEPNTITLVSPPKDSGQSLVVHASLRPTRGASQLDDDLYSRWIDAVVAGTLVRICATPGQPYTDVNQVMRYSSQYTKEANRARIEANRGRMAGPTAVRSRPFV